MNIFEKLKTLWQIRGILNTEVQEAQKMDGTKPGWKTSEFWLTLLGTTLPTLIGAGNGMIPPKWAAIVLAASSAAYGLIRAIVKANAPNAGGSDATANVTVKAS